MSQPYLFADFQVLVLEEMNEKLLHIFFFFIISILCLTQFSNEMIDKNILNLQFQHNHSDDNFQLRILLLILNIKDGYQKWQLGAKHQLNVAMLLKLPSRLYLSRSLKLVLIPINCITFSFVILFTISVIFCAFYGLVISLAHPKNNRINQTYSYFQCVKICI